MVIKYFVVSIAVKDSQSAEATDGLIEDLLHDSISDVCLGAIRAVPRGERFVAVPDPRDASGAGDEDRYETDMEEWERRADAELK